MAADAERRSNRAQGGRRCVAVCGTRADPDDQRAVVLAAHTGMAGSGRDPYGDSHDPSVCPRRPVARHCQPMTPEPTAPAAVRALPVWLLAP